MSSSDSKKARKRKSKKSGKSSPDSNTNKPHRQTEVTTDPEILDAKACDQLERLTALENDALGSPLPRGPNPYLGGERCLLCQAERLDTSKSYQEEDVGDTLSQLHLWVCSECRKTVEEEEKRASEEPLLLDQELSRLEPSSLPLFGDLGSEPTTPNGTLCTCEACTERRKIEAQHEQETQELQKCWMEVRHVVRFVYREAGTGLSESGDCDNAAVPDVNKMKEFIHRLCSRDPHQLYQRLESQGREYVIEMKVRLLKQLTSGHKTPPQAKQFVSMLLEEYSNLYAAAKKLASFLTELETEHLKRFNLTWELHNKHLFQNIIYTDPLIQNSLPMLITQLRLGAASKEEYHQDTYPNLLHRYLKFDDEMSVISVVWRDCEQLLEEYNDEQTALKAKQKMLKEDWEFFKQQRKLLEQQIMKNKPLMKGAGDSNQHSLDAQFTETMRHIFQGTKPTAEKCLCPNCNRERCPCDECTISHIITCGIINPEVAEAQSHHHHHHHHRGLMIHDPSRYVIDVKPPSMPSTTSSSGSSSPIIVDDRPIPGFDFNEGDDEIPEEIGDDEASDSDDESYIDEENEEDEEEEEEEAEPTEMKSSSGQMHLSDLNYKALVPVSKEAQDSIYDGKLDIGAAFDNCDCNHCAKAKLVEQLKAAEENKQNQCQCHACLQQSGQAIVTSLPQQLPTLPPASLHLYPHIHGSNNLHMGLHDNPAHMRPLLQPHLYELHSGLRQEKGDGPQAKNPGDLSEMDLNHEDLYCDHYCNANGEWDNYNTALDSSAKLMLKYSGNNMGSGLLDAPPPPLMSGQFTSDHLAMTVSNESIFANALKSNPGLLQHSIGKPVSSAPGVSTSLNFPTNSAGNQANSHSDLCFKNLKPINRTLLCNQSSPHVNPHTSLPSPSFSGRNMNTVGLLSGLSTAATPMTATTTTVTSGSTSHTDLSRNPFLHTLHSSFNGNHVTTTTVSSSPSHLPALTPELIRSAAISAAKEEAARTIGNNGQLGSQGQVHTCSHAHSHINNMNPHNAVSCSDSKTGHTPNTSLPSSVSSTSVGTSTPGCNDPDCDGHHDENYDSIDDSCSEQSSSASTSNQKDGKYCDCCYCEFFGHNPPMTPTSRNYAEMRDRLRLRLKKKKEQTTVTCNPEAEKPKEPQPVAPPTEKEAPLDQRGLEELIKFINGGEEGSEKQLSAKAAKRARQKQRKAEEKARKVAEQQQKELQQQLMLLKEAEEAVEREREARKWKQNPEHSSQKKKRGKNKDKENSEHNSMSQTPEMNGVNHSHPIKSKKSDQAECLQARATLAQKQMKSEQSKQVITKQVNHTGSPSQYENPRPEKVHKPKQGNHSVESPAQSRKSSVQKNAVKDASIFEGHHGLAQAKQYARLQQAFAHVDPRNHIQASLNRTHDNKTCIQAQNNMRHQQVPQAMKMDVSVAKSAINSSLNNHHHHHNKISQQQQHQQQLLQQTATQQQQQQQQQHVQQNKKKGKKTTQSSSPTLVAPLHCSGEQCRNSQNHCQNQHGHHARNHPTKTPEIPNIQKGLQTGNREVPRHQVQKTQQNGNVTPRHTSNGQARKEPSPDKKSVKEHKEASPREEKSPSDISGGSTGKNKKNKRKNKSVDDVDEIFMPKEDIETVELDESEREIEEFKRFCLDSTPLAKKEKVPVNMNLKDIFSKKKSGISCA